MVLTPNKTVNIKLPETITFFHPLSPPHQLSFFSKTTSSAFYSPNN